MHSTDTCVDPRQTESLASIVDRLRLWENRDAIVWFEGDRHLRISYAELADAVDNFATCFHEKGIRKGSFVVLSAINSCEWIIACLAAIKCGGIPVPLDTQLDEPALSAILIELNPSAVCTVRDAVQKFNRILPVDTTPIFLLDNSDASADRKHVRGAETVQPPNASPDETAALFYTSGTTGEPKGVSLSHKNIAFQIRAITQIRLVGPADRILLPLPLHHIYPFTVGMLFPLASGLPIVLPQSLTGPQLLSALRDGDVTTIVGVPRLYRALWEGIDARVKAGGSWRYRLFRIMLALSKHLQRAGLHVGTTLFGELHFQLGEALNLLACGGASLDADLGATLEALGWRVAIGYGLTETSPLLAVRQPFSGSTNNVGYPLPGVEVRIAAVDQKMDQPGEILARGPGVFHGYYNLPQKTQEAFTDDWFRTGDLGYFEHGKLHVVGRIASLIVAESGEKIDPEQLEKHYQENSFIQEIGILSRAGKLVAVVVPNMEKVRAAGAGDLERIIHDAIDGRALPLPTYKRLSGFVISRESLAKTAMGKLRRHKLSETYAKLQSAKQPVPAGQMPPVDEADRFLLSNPAAAHVLRLLEDRYGTDRVWLDAGVQLDLGIDSLEWLAVTMAICDAVGVNLSQADIGHISTVRDLLNQVSKQKKVTRAATLPLDPISEPDKVLTRQEQLWLRPLGFIMTVLQVCFYVFNWILLRLLFRLKVVGVENIPEGDQVVITPNHASFLDPFVLAGALPLSVLRKTQWAGWTGIAFGNRCNRFISRLAQAVPIDADHALVSSLAFGAAVLRTGRNLIWFPEGRRTLTGELQPFKGGLGLLLERIPVKVVPVFLSGTREALPPGKRMIRLRQVTVTFGSPESPTDLEQQGTGDSPYERIVSGLRSKVAILGSIAERRL